PRKNNLYGINQYEANREIFRAMHEGLNAVIAYAPLFKEDINLVNKLISYCITKINTSNTIISFGKLNNFIDVLCYLKHNEIADYICIEVEENILFNELVIKLNINVKTSGFLKNVYNAISYLYNKNKVKLDSEISFWLNNTNYYVSNNMLSVTSS